MAIARIQRSQLDIGEERDLNPYLLLGYYEEYDSNRPIVMFARRLGMVINYAYKDEWVHGVSSPDDPNDYVFAFFVPFLEETKKLKDNLSIKKYAGKTLEEYLISCEASDHEGWEDHDRMTLVSSIQRQVTNKLKLFIKNDDIIPAGTSSDRLGNALSRIIGLSKAKEQNASDTDGKGGKSESRSIKLRSSVYEFDGNMQILNFELECLKGLKQCSVVPIIYSDSTNLKCIEWESVIGSSFPIEYSKLEIFLKPEKAVIIPGGKETISVSGIDVLVSIETDSNSRHNSNKYSKIKFVFSKSIEDNFMLYGRISLNTLSIEYEYDLLASEGGEAK